MRDLSNTPFREVIFPSAAMSVEEQADGTLVVRPETELEAFEPNLLLELERQAANLPDKAYLLERFPGNDNWTAHTYRDTQRDVHAVAQWFIDAGVSADRSLLILSGNSIMHAVFKFGALAAGVPTCPVSVNYALMGGDFARLRHVIDLVRPAVVFAEDTEQFGKALDAVDFGDAQVVTADPLRTERESVAIADVLETRPGPAVAARIRDGDPDAAAFYMLTSGSTSLPKAVIQTQRMVAANLSQGRQVLGESAGWKDVMLDWLPWNHVSGAFTQMGVMISGGSLYIDTGRPLPGLFDTTIQNLKDVPVGFFTNVPAGYAMLVDALEKDTVLRKTFFSKLRLALYGGAGLPQALYERFQRLAVDTIGKRIFFTTGYGSTETASGCMAIYFDSEEVGIGLPMPGLTIKLLPLDDDRYEIRMSGQMVTPGYLGEPGKSAEMFDEEGFFRIGDAVSFIEPGNIERGLRFAGRLAEEFKLASGTWVAAGNLRAAVVQQCSPIIADALVCGLNRDYVAVLAWPSAAGVEQVSVKAPGTAATLVADPGIREAIEKALAEYNAANPGSSTRIRRFAFLDDPPSIDGHELSDKGTVNQAVALRRRHDDVERLYAEQPDESVIVL